MLDCPVLAVTFLLTLPDLTAPQEDWSLPPSLCTPALKTTLPAPLQSARQLLEQNLRLHQLLERAFPQEKDKDRLYKLAIRVLEGMLDFEASIEAAFRISQKVPCDPSKRPYHLGRHSYEQVVAEAIGLSLLNDDPKIKRIIGYLHAATHYIDDELEL